MMRRLLIGVLPFLLLSSDLHAKEVKTTLKGSRASMQRQNRIAHEMEYSFLRTGNQVERFAEEGYLVEVPGNADYDVIASYPFARPVVKEFVERLAADYHAGCGEELVVTSLTRPSGRQPRNASPLSVHPAGMAVDLRVSRSSACVSWLQDALLALESDGLIDATREYHPPHFHIAVFPEAYAQYAAAIVADSIAAAERARADSLRQAELQALGDALPPMGELKAAPRPDTLDRVLVAVMSLVSFMLPV